jgi:hypothetical protein
MPKTSNWEIEYPNGTVAPNVPVVMQAQAVSVENALNSIAIAPLIICQKAHETQTLVTAGAFTDIRWDGHVHIQGIEHTPGDSTFIVSEDGIYNVNARVAFNGPNVTGTIFIYVNGIRLDNTLEDEIGGPTAWPKPRILHYVKLQAGDAVTIVGVSNQPNTVLSSESSFQMAKIAGF